MMTRRKFLTYTVALAACAPIARLSVARDLGVLTPEPAPAHAWVPTQEQVDEWLEYYKISVWQGCKGFSDVINTVFVDQPADETLEMYRQAERAFDALEHDRVSVAVSQGFGYQAGRDGLPRVNPEYSAASNEAFGWYNMWAVGDRDRRGVRLPRSPGVSWPEGKRPNPWLKYQ